MKPLFLIALIAGLSTFSPAWGEESQTTPRRYIVQYGSLPNIESGAESTIGLNSLLFDFTSESIESDSKYNYLLRFMNVSILQMYIGFTTYGTLPHEYFGHYSRCREFGIKPEKLRINFPSLGGSIVFHTTYDTPAIERQMISAGGPETTGMIAYKATRQMYSGRSVPSYIGNYQLAKIVDGIVYIEMNVKPFRKNPRKYYDDRLGKETVPNDPLAYILALTESYGYYDSFINKNDTWMARPSDSARYTNAFFNDQYKRMKRAFWLSALDPVILHFLYGNYQYLVNGERFYKPALISVGQFHVMPSIRANLGELGAENYFDIFFGFANSPQFGVYYRTGGNMIHQLRGGGINAEGIELPRDLKFNTEFDFWYNERNSSRNINVRGELTYDIFDSFLIGLSLGYKDRGGLMGKPFGAGIYSYFTFGKIMRL